MTAAVRSTIWRSTVLFIAHTATHQWIFVYHSQHGRRHWDIMILAPDINIQTYLLTNLQPRQREENRTVHCGGKSEAEVTNNRRLHSTYCTIDNYWHTRGIARPVCDSRATCTSWIGGWWWWKGECKSEREIIRKGEMSRGTYPGRICPGGGKYPDPFYGQPPFKPTADGRPSQRGIIIAMNGSSVIRVDAQTTPDMNSTDDRIVDNLNNTKSKLKPSINKI